MGRLILLPLGAKIPFRPGDTVLDAVLDHGVPMEHECGGNCACTTCHVKVLSGAEALSPMEEPEADMLTAAEGRSAESRLACQAILLGGDVTVQVMGSG
jgi:2Fe-2S ferredoxin